MERRPRRLRNHENPPSFRRSDIDAHHRSLEEQFSAILAEEVRVVGPERWWCRADREAVVFDLIGRESGYFERAQRKGGAWQRVVAVKDRETWWGDCRAWVSWHEQWLSVRGRSFELQSAGATVFWGPWQEKRQLLRAEWAEPPSHSGKAAQPHWHADFEEFVDASYAAYGSMGEIENLGIEQGDPTTFGISLSGCHLAMGGWRCTDVSGNPWQTCVGNELAHLSEWGKMTLNYIVAQLGQCGRADATA